MKYLLVWLLLLGYAIFVAPGEGEDLLLRSLLTGDFQSVDPLVLMIFSFLGLYPLLFVFILYGEESSTIIKWPFALGSFVLGAFTLLPYYFLHEKYGKKKHYQQRTNRIVHNKFLLAIFALLFVLTALSGIGGTTSGYYESFFVSRLVSVMTIDFLVLVWLATDRLWQRREQFSLSPFVSIVPILGSILVLLSQKKRT